MTASLAAIADHARQLADAAPAPSIERRAAGAVAVACATCRTLSTARAALGGIRSEHVRQAAIALLDQLAEQED